MNKRILFVDDEPRILEGLRNRLRCQRSKWDMSFVDSGQKALEILGAERIDVIVSDMRMPQMDGTMLLKRVQKEHPHVVRIVLSGHSELEASLRAVPVAHQFLAKPCDPGVLEGVVERACDLQALISDSVLRHTVAKIKSLPSLPHVYSQLLAVLADENVSVDAVARVLKQDLAMCAKLLQMVNSAFVRLSRSISRIEEAVSYLGFNTVTQLVLTVEVFRRGGEPAILAGVHPERLQEHSLLTASVAMAMFDDKKKREDAFMAALLHDIGKLLMAIELPDHVREVAAVTRAEGGTMYAAEEKLWGVTHAEIGAYLLGLWGLPYPVVEAVANHHAPSRVRDHGFDLVAAIHLADALANEQMDPVIPAERPEVDPAYAAVLGIEEKVDAWRQVAQKQALAVGASKSATN